MPFKNRPLSLKTTITLFVCTVVLISLLITGALMGKDVAARTKNNLSEKAMNIARIVGHSPSVIQALEGKRNASTIETFAKHIRTLTGVRYIVVTDMHGIRKSHPDTNRIGKHFVGGDEKKALHGKEYVSEAVGTLGPSMRAFEPIRNASGKQVGVVAVGIMMDRVHEDVLHSIGIICICIGIGILAGILGALLLARKIKNVLFGLEPFQIANLWQERNAMLESVREGIVAINQEGRIILTNKEALRMFQLAGIQGDPSGRKVEEYLPQFRLDQVVKHGNKEYDQELELNGISLVVNRVPVKLKNQTLGAMATFRNKTELKQLAEQLTGVKMYAEALRTKAHEFMNKLHVILGMIHIGDYENLNTYVQTITNQYQMEIGSVSRLVKDPVLAGLLLSKLSYAREQDVNLHLSGNRPLLQLKKPELTDEMVTILGNLIDNGIEAVEGCEDKDIDVSLDYDGWILTLSVRDNGGGVPEEWRERIFENGFSTKGDNRGYGLFLVRNSIKTLGGCITVDVNRQGTQFIVKIPIKDEKM